MKYLELSGNNAAFHLAAEYYLTEFDPFGGADICWFWRTVPTVVIGRYQVAQAEVNLPYLEEHGIRLVRRHSGGGTIYSDENNLMFSMVTKSADEGINFQAFTQPLVELFNAWGLPVTHSGRNDLFLYGKKFSGNAQFHHNGFTVHHGTLLIDSDFERMACAINPPAEKIRANGVASVREHVINLKPYLPAAVCEDGLDVHLKNALCDGVVSFTDAQIETISSIAKERFCGWEVLFGKSPKFTITRSRRFAGGSLGANLAVEHGIIREVQVFGDFFGDADPMCRALEGVPYTQADILNALRSVALPHEMSAEELAESFTDVAGR
ncbi:MAG: lipoate--protein ligase [Oscillospiraceae bacterium]|nr:lipoate--protein ligase [Oscillospiraceae bacterium]